MSFPVLTYYVLNKLKPSFRGTVKGISSSHLSQLCWGLSHHICAAIKVGVFQVTHREKLESWHLSASSSRFFLTLLNEDSIVSSSQQGRKARATVDSFLHDASSWCFWLCLLNGRWRLSNNLSKCGIYVLFSDCHNAFAELIFPMSPCDNWKPVLHQPIHPSLWFQPSIFLLWCSNQQQISFLSEIILILNQHSKSEKKNQQHLFEWKLEVSRRQQHRLSLQQEQLQLWLLPNKQSKHKYSKAILISRLY